MPPGFADFTLPPIECKGVGKVSVNLWFVIGYKMSWPDAMLNFGLMTSPRSWLGFVKLFVVAEA